MVQGRYCHVCGQENIVPHETFWHMVKHFVYDITHFDSKLFDSLRYLFRKPGFLPKEYISGRRASYVNPVKQYVFTSFVFFLVFFATGIGKGTFNFDFNKPVSPGDREKYIAQAIREWEKDSSDIVWITMLRRLRDTTQVFTNADVVKYFGKGSNIAFGNKTYSSKREYDSIQQALPPGKRDGWLTRQFVKRDLKLREKYKDDPARSAEKLEYTFFHNLPYLLFVSLPLFALFLKLLYIRHKKLYYADHGIFCIYHYIFTFMLLLLVYLFIKISEWVHVEFIRTIGLLLFLSGGLYLYLSMKRFYGQGHGKTIVKFLVLNLLGIIMLLALFVLFMIISAFLI